VVLGPNTKGRIAIFVMYKCVEVRAGLVVLGPSTKKYFGVKTRRNWVDNEVGPYRPGKTKVFKR
jgi:hypothetical protein